MSEYIVSARKYRPDSFESLIGQDNIARTLKNSILRGQLAHAYLFCGPRGVGKTSTARIFAKAINCSNPTGQMEPCGECESCRSFREGRSFCIHELDAASNNSVDDIRALTDKVQIPPQVGRYSVYIIDEVHMLSQSAFNAFLKVLEEPPAHAIFILATTEKHKIIPTILSRCQTFDFNRIGIQDIVRNLRQIALSEGITVDDESLHVIARKADGAMRDALTIFDQTVAFCGTDIHYEDVIRNLNVLDYEYSFRLVDAFLSSDYATALLTFDEILAKGFNALYFISALGSHLRDLLVSRTAGLDSLLDYPDALKKKYAQQAARCSVRFIYDALTITTQCEAGYKASANQRLHIEYALMRLSFITAAPSGGQVQASVPAAAPAAPVSSGGQLQTSAPVAAPATPAPAPAVSAPASAPAPATPTAPSAATAPASLSGVSSIVPPVSEPAAVQPSAPAPALAQAPAPAPENPSAASAEPAPAASVATPADAPAQTAEPAPAPAPRKRPVRNGASLSLSALISEKNAADEAPALEPSGEEAPLPELPFLQEKWNLMVGETCGDKPRLKNALEKAQLTLDTESGIPVLDFTVTNEAQKKWIEDGMLSKLEAAMRMKSSCGTLKLVISVLPEEKKEDIKYLPEEKARDLMDRNPEVRNLVKDFELDVK